MTAEAFAATARPAGIAGEAFDGAVELLSGPPPDAVERQAGRLLSLMG
ncbi:hypothetical protein IOD16_28030 [Saccharothrix sp. 6-C]|nr:hypothetical protein [Saccharothrix sp. 6-C]QQQ74944.1 hypothetical protein IOD16_28030 [Saccharothrix sp. 6-C]